MQREVLAAPQFWTVGQTIDHVRKPATTCPSCSSTSTSSTRPTGRSAPRRSASCCAPSARRTLAEIMEPVTDITVDMDQEEVAYIFDKYHLISGPGRRRRRAAGRPDHRR
jgi:magnesium transporter